MTTYKFYYFDVRNQGEVCRQLFALANVEYEDIRYSMEEWPMHKDDMPMKQLPVLAVNGKKIPQSSAIARYLVKKFGYAGKTAYERAIVDALADAYKDFYHEIGPYLYAAIGLKPGNVEELKKTALLPGRDKYLATMTSYLKKSKTGFLAGGELTWADLTLAEGIVNPTMIVPGFADDYPLVHAQYKTYKVTEDNEYDDKTVAPQPNAIDPKSLPDPNGIEATNFDPSVAILDSQLSASKLSPCVIECVKQLGWYRPLVLQYCAYECLTISMFGEESVQKGTVKDDCMQKCRSSGNSEGFCSDICLAFG